MRHCCFGAHSIVHDSEVMVLPCEVHAGASLLGGIYTTSALL